MVHTENVYGCSGLEVAIGGCQDALRAERSLHQDNYCPIYPYIGCKAVVKANQDDLIPLARDWFRVKIQHSCGQ